MADHLTMSTEHYISPGNAGQPAANTAPMASAAATTSGEVDTATGSEHNGGVNDEGHQENHQENGEESVTEFSDLVSGYEAITVADTALGTYTFQFSVTVQSSNSEHSSSVFL
jgi:hypothetical protein